MLYDYELFKQEKHYIRLKTRGEWDSVMKELEAIGITWESGSPIFENRNVAWEIYVYSTIIFFRDSGIVIGRFERHTGNRKEILPLEKGETKMTNKGMNMKELYDEIEKIYFNENKRTTVIKFKDGSTVKATASENTEFCEYAGFTAALMKRKYGKLENITKLIERKKS